MKLISLLRKAWGSIGIGVYLLDAVTDSRTSVFHFLNNDFWWGLMTIGLVILPLIITGAVSTYSVMQHHGTSMEKKLKYLLVGIALWPLLPLLLMIEGAIAMFREDAVDTYKFVKIGIIANFLIAFTTIVGHGPDDAILSAGLIKLLEVMLESAPQATLQLYIIAQTCGKDVEYFQWISIVVSLTCLTLGISTNQYVFENGKIAHKAIIFVFGFITITSRIMVSCLYSMVINYLMFVPISVELACSIIACQMNKLTECWGSDIWGMVIMFMTWLLTASYDSFTLSGLPASVLNLGFAVGSLWLKVPQPAAIIAIVISAISLVCNIILTLVPTFRENFGDKWMKRNTLKLSSEEIESKKFELKYYTAKDYYTRPTISDDTRKSDWRKRVYGADNMERIQGSSEVYLAKSSRMPGTVRWRIKWSGSGLVPKEVTVKLLHRTESTDGIDKVTWYTVIGYKTFIGGVDGHQHLTEADLELGPVRHMDLVARLEGSGDWAARILHQHPNDKECTLYINILFKET